MDPKKLQPARLITEEIPGCQKDEEEKDRDELPGGFVLAEGIRRKNLALACRELAKTGDQEFAGDNHDHCPRGQSAQWDETDQSRGDEDLVGQWIHELPEIRDLVELSSQVSVKPVSQ